MIGLSMGNTGTVQYNRSFGPFKRETTFAPVITQVAGYNCSPMWPDTPKTVTLMNRYGEYSAAGLVGFHKRKTAKEFLPFTSYRRVDSEYVYSGSTGVTAINAVSGCEERYVTKPSNQDENILLDVLNSASDLYDDEEIRRLSIEAFASCTADLDLLTNIAELKKTLKLYKDMAGQYNKLAALAWRKHGGNRGFRRKLAKNQLRLGDMKDVWLGARYGWSQLVYQLQDVVAALEGRYNIIHHKLHSGGPTQVEVSMPQTDKVAYTYGSSTCLLDIRVETTSNISYGTHASCQFSHRRNYMADPFITAWELIPYTWLWDRFVNTGSSIKAWHVFRRSADTAAAGMYRLEGRRVLTAENLRTVNVGDYTLGNFSYSLYESTHGVGRFRHSRKYPSLVRPIFKGNTDVDIFRDVLMLLTPRGLQKRVRSL